MTYNLKTRVELDEMVDEIESIILEVFSEHGEIDGISIATLGGKTIYSKFRDKSDFKISPMEMAAGTTSLVFIAANLFEKTFNQDVSYTISKGEQQILLAIMNETISGSVLFDRKLAELSGLKELRNEMTRLFLKISAIIETSKFFKKDLFVQIKRAIPNSLSIAIINKDGLPIKVQSNIDASHQSAFIYALYQLTNSILGEKKDYMIIGGEFHSIIIMKIDEERILGIAVPESDDAQLGKVIGKIQEITRDIE